MKFDRFIFSKYLFHFLCFMYLGVSLGYAQSNKELLFVSQFKNDGKQNIPSGELTLIENLFRTEAANSNLLVINQDNVEALLPPGETLESCSQEANCEVALGKKLQAHYIITGELYFFSNQYNLSVRLSRTSDASMISSLDLSATDLNTLKGELKIKASELIGKINRGKMMFFKQDKNLFISLSPNDADLYLDYIKVEKNQLQIVKGGFLTTAPLGKHTISAKKEGYLEQLEEVFINNEGISNIEFKLQPTLKKDESCLGKQSDDCTGTIYIYSTPAGAEVWLDGLNTKQRTIPDTNQSNLGIFAITTTPGEHLVELRFPKYQSARQVIQVRKGDFETELYKQNPMKLVPNFGKLNLITQPANASVKINGELKSYQTPYVDPELTAGYYEIIVEAKNHHSRKELVQIEKNQTLNLNWELKKDFSNVAIRVYDQNQQEGISKAKMILNGNHYVSDSNGYFQVGQLKAGQYDMLISHELYEPINHIEMIKDGGQLNEIKLRLKPKFGVLSIRIQEEYLNMTDYQVYIANVPTPLRLPIQALKLPTGNHTIKLMPVNTLGFEEETIKVALGLGENQQIVYQPKKKEGILVINSNPFGAEVLIDHQPKGKTPLKISLLQGKHLITLKANQYDPYVEEIEIKQGQRLDKNIQLGQHPNLQIFCIPEQAKVWVNGKSLGVSPQTFIDRPGLVDVQCRLGDAMSNVRSLRTYKGQEERIHLEIDQNLIESLRNNQKSRSFWGKTLIFGGLGVIGVGAGFQGLVTQEVDQRNQNYQNWLMSSDAQSISNYQSAIDRADHNAQLWNQASWITMGLGLAISGIGAFIYASQPEVVEIKTQVLPKTSDFKRILDLNR